MSEQNIKCINACMFSNSDIVDKFKGWISVTYLNNSMVVQVI